MPNAYILLHGLFFLEYQNDTLVVTAPAIDDHDYRIGNPEDGKNLKKAPVNQILHWEKTTLTGASKNAFPGELLQFSKKYVGCGDITTDPSEFQFQIILPRPINIFPLRNGDRSLFPALPGKVLSSIQSQPHATNIALVLCLQYQGSFDSSISATNRVHIYAECDCDPGIDHVNAAYREVNHMFTAVGFDLTLDSNATITPVQALSPAVDDPRLTDLQGRDKDESSLSEFYAAAAGILCPLSVNVANCGQFGVLP